MPSQSSRPPSPLREAFKPVLLGLVSSALFLALFDLTAFHAFPAAATRVDLLIRAAVHSIAAQPLTAASIFVTWLGSTPVLACIALALFLVLRDRIPRFEAALPVMAVACAELVGEAAKFIVSRPRPHSWFGLHDPQSWSFPSGHSLDSTVCYLVFGALLLPLIQSRTPRACVAGLAFALPLIIGLTRIYLGMHWPTDVLAGWIAGLCLAGGLVRSLRIEAATHAGTRAAA